VIQEQDRVVWVGDPSVRPVGSSGKARVISAPYLANGFILVGWGGGNEGPERVGVDVVSCEEAGRRGIEPWTAMVQ
jgi:hypothetical protein